MKLRMVKGAKLTPAEVDANFTGLREFCNSLASLYGVSLGTDGKILAGSVGTTELANRSVTEPKLAFTACHFAVAGGSGNALTATFTPAMAAYADGTLLFIQTPYANTGAATLAVDGMAAKSIRKNGVYELVADDLVASGVIALLYYGGVFHLVAGSGGSGGGGGGSVSGMAEYEPASVALQGSGFPYAHEFTHGLGDIPTIVNAWLVCITADLGYVVGDRVPLDNFCDADGEPCFSLQVTTSKVTVEQHFATPKLTKLVDPDKNTPQDITPGSWQIGVRAYLSTASVTPIIAPIHLQLANVRFGYPHGNEIFLAQYNRRSVAPGANTLSFGRWNMQTNRFNRITTSAGWGHQWNGSKWRFSGGYSDGDKLVLTNTGGIYTMLLTSPYTISTITAGGGVDGDMGKCIWVTEAANPDIYTVADRGAVLTNAIPCVKNYYSGAAYTEAAHGTAVNLHDALITGGLIAHFQEMHSSFGSGASPAQVILFQYNPIKRRIYVVTDGTGLLWIFELSLTYANIATWWSQVDATRYANITCVKAIGLPIVADKWTDATNERIVVDWDLDSGQEISICQWFIGDAGWTGGIKRVPWKEDA